MLSVRAIVVLYVALYVAATSADALSTLAGLRAGGAEFNPHVADAAQAVQWTRFLGLNALVLLATTLMLGWAWARRDRIDAGRLEAPWRGLYECYTYLNPFADRNVPRSALHLVATAPAIIGCKLFVAANNLLVANGVPDPLTPVAHWLSGRLDDAVAYWCLIVLLWQPFWAASLYATAAALRNARARQASFGAATPLSAPSTRDSMLAA